MSLDRAADAKSIDKPANGALAHRLNVTARGLVFVWLGVAVMAHLGWGWSLLGIGVIVLGEQAARWRLNLPMSAKWAIGGAIFLIGGLWQLIHISFPLAPLLLILLGVAILWNGFFGKGAD